MEFYHYSTWRGSQIYESGYILLKDRYALWADKSIVASWPALIFLTTNKYWEPSIQTRSKQNYFEKCGSCPEVYWELGIPCWKFIPEEIEVYPVKELYTLDMDWQAMLKDAEQLGSNINEWYYSTWPLKLTAAYRWVCGDWRLLP